MTKLLAVFGLGAIVLGGGWLYYSGALSVPAEENNEEVLQPEGAGGGSTQLAEGERVTLEGTITCLPHKGDGPHTMECAFGLQTPDGTHYGLSNLWDVAPTMTDTNVEVEVTGTFSPAPANEKYDITGYITVEAVERL